jgi:hypothetical protein
VPLVLDELVADELVADGEVGLRAAVIKDGALVAGAQRRASRSTPMSRSC